MTLRRRLTLATALAVGLAVALACGVAYLVVRGELRSQIDEQLTGQARIAAGVSAVRVPSGGRDDDRDLVVRQPTPGEGGPLGYIQLLDAKGVLREDPRGTAAYRLPIDAADRRLASTGGASLLRTVEQDGARLRMLTVALADGGAAQLARPLDGVESVLRRLGLILVLVCVGGVGLAAVLGRVVTRRVTAPLREVAAAAGHIAETDELGRRLVIRSRDEVGDLAGRFNSMLDRLEASRAALSTSVEAQRQLVADASHELRTPITSLRTNIEVLLEGDALDPRSREDLLDDVREQIEELGALVVDVIELARGDAQPAASEPVRLDELATTAVERAQRHHGGVRFVVDAVPVDLDGDPDRLARAIGNLLENAAKHSPAGGAVEVRVDGTGVTVRDHGPGLAAADLPHLFDRFYRGSNAQGLPGTGLGLAIVRQVAEMHGGRVTAANAPDGGACFRLELPAPALPWGAEDVAVSHRPS